ncbi:DUF4365 domain-containing protein [Novosphingobium sp. 11B]
MPAITTAENDIKERMSIGLITLIAARAGCEVQTYSVDRTSRDISISPISGSPVQIDAQLKATVNLIDSGEVLKFDLPVKNYNDLRATQVANAQILIVVDLHDLHDLPDHWLEGVADQMVFRKCAYWLSLYGMPATSNGNKIRVDIPKNQIFNSDQLGLLMERRLEKIQQNDGGL